MQKIVGLLTWLILEKYYEDRTHVNELYTGYSPTAGTRNKWKNFRKMSFYRNLRKLVYTGYLGL